MKTGTFIPVDNSIRELLPPCNASSWRDRKVALFVNSLSEAHLLVYHRSGSVAILKEGRGRETVSARPHTCLTSCPAAHLHRLVHALDRYDVSAEPIVHAVLGRCLMHGSEGAGDALVEQAVNGLFIPVEVGRVLNLLEVADGDPAGIGEDVRENDDTPVVEDFVGLGGGRTIGAFNDDLGTNLRGGGRRFR